MYWNELREFAVIFDRWSGIIVATLAYVLLNLLLVLAWRKIVVNIGGDLTLKESFIIYGRSQVAKYIPGNIFQYVGRHVISRKVGISNSVVIDSIFLETVLLIVSSSLLSLIVFLFLGWRQLLPLKVGQVFLILGIMIFISVLTFFIIKFVPGFRQWLVRKNLLVDFKDIDLKNFLLVLIFVLCLYIIFFSGSSLLLWLLTRYFWTISNISFLIFVGVYAISWVAGFITPGAPGGMGVREAILLALLGSYLLESKVLMLVLVFRFITIIGDVLLFGFTYVFLEKKALT